MKDLDELLEEAGYTFKVKSVIDITDDNGIVIASLFVEDKYIQFHNEFTQIGITMPLFEQLINEDGFSSNHC